MTWKSIVHTLYPPLMLQIQTRQATGNTEPVHGLRENGDETRQPEKLRDPANEVESARLGEVESSMPGVPRGAEEGAGKDDDQGCPTNHPTMQRVHVHETPSHPTRRGAPQAYRSNQEMRWILNETRVLHTKVWTQRSARRSEGSAKPRRSRGRVQ
jgi:hypothetical protein